MAGNDDELAPYGRTPNGARMTTDAEVTEWETDRGSRGTHSVSYTPRFKHRGKTEAVAHGTCISELEVDPADAVMDRLRFMLRKAGLDTAGLVIFDGKDEDTERIPPHLTWAYRNPGATQAEDREILAEVAAAAPKIARVRGMIPQQVLEATGFLVMTNQIVVRMPADSWNPVLDGKAATRIVVPELKDGAYSLDHSPLSKEPFGEIVQWTVAAFDRDGVELAPLRAALTDRFSVPFTLKDVVVGTHIHNPDTILARGSDFARVDLLPAQELTRTRGDLGGQQLGTPGE